MTKPPEERDLIMNQSSRPASGSNGEPHDEGLFPSLTGHLIQKNWVPADTDWADFLYRVLAMQPRGSVR